MKTPSIGKVQLKIMRFLWSNKRANAKEITEALNSSEPIAHSTVQTLLRQLEEKKVLAHESLDRTFIFYPLIEERDYKRGATRELLGSFFDGSPSELFAFLFENETVDPEELALIRRMIQEKKSNNEGGAA